MEWGQYPNLQRPTKRDFFLATSRLIKEQLRSAPSLSATVMALVGGDYSAEFPLRSTPPSLVVKRYFIQGHTCSKKRGWHRENPLCKKWEYTITSSCCLLHIILLSQLLDPGTGSWAFVDGLLDFGILRLDASNNGRRFMVYSEDAFRCLSSMLM